MGVDLSIIFTEDVNIWTSHLLFIIQLNFEDAYVRSWHGGYGREGRFACPIDRSIEQSNGPVSFCLSISTTFAIRI